MKEIIPEHVSEVVKTGEQAKGTASSWTWVSDYFSWEVGEGLSKEEIDLGRAAQVLFCTKCTVGLTKP